MTDRQALLAAVLAAPDDDAPRLVYADFLDDHGDAARAEYIRGEIRYARDGQKMTEAGGCSCPTHRVIPPEERCVYCQCDRSRKNWLDRHKELAWVESYTPYVVPDPAIVLDDFEWHRGFIRSIALSAADCLAHLDAIRAEHPIRKVRLATWPGVQSNEATESWRLRGDSLTDGPFRAWRKLDGLPASSTDGRAAVAALLKIEWPGIEFELPPEPLPRLVTTLRGRAGDRTELTFDFSEYRLGAGSLDSAEVQGPGLTLGAPVIAAGRSQIRVAVSGPAGDHHLVCTALTRAGDFLQGAVLLRLGSPDDDAGAPGPA